MVKTLCWSTVEWRTKCPYSQQSAIIITEMPALLYKFCATTRPTGNQVEIRILSYCVVGAQATPWETNWGGLVMSTHHPDWDKFFFDCNVNYMHMGLVPSNLVLFPSSRVVQTHASSLLCSSCTNPFHVLYPTWLHFSIAEISSKLLISPALSSFLCSTCSKPYLILDVVHPSRIDVK